jgi:hypothetical protein
MRNWYCVHIGNAHIESTHRCIANTIVSPVISGDLGDMPWSENWRNCVHDQGTQTGILLIIITVGMIDKISCMPDRKYRADCRLNGGSVPFLERRNFRFFLNCHWWDLINTKLHYLHCLCNIAHGVSGSRLRRITWNIRDANFLPHWAFFGDADLCTAPSPGYMQYQYKDNIHIVNLFMLIYWFWCIS